MKGKRSIAGKLLLLFTVSAGLALISCSKHMEDAGSGLPQKSIMYVSGVQNNMPVPGQYIVIMKDNIFRNANIDLVKAYHDRNGLWAQQLNRFLASAGLTDLKLDEGSVFSTAVHGFVTMLTPRQYDMLHGNPGVAYIEQDRYVSLGKGNGGGGSTGGTVTQPPQSTPWGVKRVGGTGSGSGKVAWIIDSGVQLDHPDLNVNTTLSVSCLTKANAGNWRSATDEYGHGTHVAGTIAAKDNTIGCVGVAAGASVISVRVLDKNGSGSVSNVVKGVDYVASKASSGDVANMSLGGATSTTLDDAVKNLASKGVYVVIAAGNNKDDCANYSPSRVNATNVYTISSMDSLDNFSTAFSNYGSGVDYAAPGEYVYSCYINSGYATASGTSMAAPHVAGILLLNSGSISSNGTVYKDPDGTSDAIAHE